MVGGYLSYYKVVKVFGFICEPCPELVLEIAARTQFPKDFTSIMSGHSPEDPDLTLSLCAVLVAEACNISLGPVAREDHPALTLDRLAFVKQNYVRPETIARCRVSKLLRSPTLKKATRNAIGIEDIEKETQSY